MTNECISPLRQRMIEDMSLRHFGEKTQKDYIRAVKNLTIFLGRSPDTATAEDLRLFQLHLTENRVRPPSINFTVTALRFFFTERRATSADVIAVAVTRHAEVNRYGLFYDATVDDDAKKSGKWVFTFSVTNQSDRCCIAVTENQMDSPG